MKVRPSGIELDYLVVLTSLIDLCKSWGGKQLGEISLMYEAATYTNAAIKFWRNFVVIWIVARHAHTPVKTFPREEFKTL